MLDPVAIIGIVCRFPGARDTESLWRLFRDGVDTLTEVPADRWDVDLFDARPFGIAPYQIGQIDPQQRLILKIALENSGITPEKLSGRHCGLNHRLQWNGSRILRKISRFLWGGIPPNITGPAVLVEHCVIQPHVWPD